MADDATINEIRTAHHPKTHQVPKIRRSKGHGSSHHTSTHPSGSSVQMPLSHWWPYFRTCEDFLIAEIIMESGLSEEQSDKLIKLIHRCIEGKGSLTFSSFEDVEAARERASMKMTLVSLRVILALLEKVHNLDTASTGLVVKRGPSGSASQRRPSR
jgi:hypothetical protein